MTMAGIRLFLETSFKARKNHREDTQEVLERLRGRKWFPRIGQDGREKLQPHLQDVHLLEQGAHLLVQGAHLLATKI